MANAPAPMANQVVIFRDVEFEGYYDVYTVSTSQRKLEVANLHDINWPNTRNNESTDISSFKLGSDVSITIHSDYNLSGEHQTFDREIRSLRDHDMPDGKNNWNNEIKSFVIHMK